jgi:deoxyribose-phosphate aldolase
MLDPELREWVEAARNFTPTLALLERLPSLTDLAVPIDLDAGRLAALHRDALAGPVAAVSASIAHAAAAGAALAGSGVALSARIDYPDGIGSPEDIMRDTERALEAGAREIEIVFPYRRFLGDSPPPASKNIRAVRDIGGYDIRVKAILEANVYATPELLAQAAEIAVEGGADFLVTASEADPRGTNLESAAIVLWVIKETGFPCGFKAGALERADDGAPYLALAELIMGEGWATKERFRVGFDILPALLTEAS